MAFYQYRGKLVLFPTRATYQVVTEFDSKPHVSSTMEKFVRQNSGAYFSKIESGHEAYLNEWVEMKDVAARSTGSSDEPNDLLAKGTGLKMTFMVKSSILGQDPISTEINCDVLDRP